MFYDLDEPIAFVEQVVDILDDDGIWHFEQSYLPQMLVQNAYDTVCHEHLEYYCFRQIKWLMDRCGLKVIEVELNDVNGGSFGVTVAKAGSHYEEDVPAVSALLKAEDSQGLHTLKPYQAFKERVFRHREELLTLLFRPIPSGAPECLGYGASTKGNVSFNSAALRRSIFPLSPM